MHIWEKKTFIIKGHVSKLIKFLLHISQIWNAILFNLKTLFFKL